MIVMMTGVVVEVVAAEARSMTSRALWLVEVAVVGVEEVVVQRRRRRRLEPRRLAVCPV